MAAVQRAGLTLDLSGLAAIERSAKKRAVTLKAVKAGAKLVQSSAKARAPRRSGALRQSLGIKSGKGTRGKTLAYAVIGARKKVIKMVTRTRGGKKVKAVPAKYSHLVEKGTKPHGTHPGARPKPFLRPAFDDTKKQAIATAQRVMAEEIQRIITQQAAKLRGK